MIFLDGEYAGGRRVPNNNTDPSYQLDDLMHSQYAQYKLLSLVSKRTAKQLELCRMALSWE